MITISNKNFVYKLILFLVIILITAVAGCSSGPSTPVTSPAPFGTAAAATNPRPGFSGFPRAQDTTPAPTPSITAPVTAAAASPTSTPLPALSSAISTAIPVLSLSGSYSTIAGSPTILITAPLNVSTMASGDIAVSVSVANFNLTEKTGQANQSGEGHVIYYLDVYPPIIPGQTAITDTGTSAAAAATTYTWHNLPAGSHTVSVQLVNNDNTPLVPPATATVYITVKNP